MTILPLECFSDVEYSCICVFSSVLNRFIFSMLMHLQTNTDPNLHIFIVAGLCSRESMKDLCKVLLTALFTITEKVRPEYHFLACFAQILACFAQILAI